jgi:2-dehydro-3-deoxy-D-arabinonate dehydratase
MQIIKFSVPDEHEPFVGVVTAAGVTPIGQGRLLMTDILHSRKVADSIAERLKHQKYESRPLDSVRVLPPIDDQEVWGAGVTYERSKVAREHESDQAATFYDRVYRADRPELFFKATPSRVVGTGEPIRVRRDSQWSVPEPELALVLSAALELVGFTIGNDVSARDIEGENPLYLPQAKVYDSCCALGPGITLAEAMPATATIGITLEISRGGTTIHRGETSIARMARRFEDLIDWLGRDNHFPHGVILLTGTGIVPPDDFSLRADDVVRITIDGIGTLVNPVIQAAEAS